MRTIMIKFLGNIIGWFCLLITLLLTIAYIFSPNGQKTLNIDKQEEIKSYYWKDVLIEEGYSENVISECENILTDIGIYNLGEGFCLSETKSIVVNCYNNKTKVIIGFDNDEIESIFFYGDLVYSKENGQVATVDWEKRKLTYIDDYMGGITVTLLD